MPLRREINSRQPVDRDVTLTYSQGVPASGTADGPVGLQILTSTSSSFLSEYLQAWYQRGATAGGGERPIRRYEQDTHELTVLWPDGRAIRISPTSIPQSAFPSREMLERIADSLTAVSEADLMALRDRAEANIEALPVVASAETNIGTVDVHGRSGFLRLCLRGSSEQGPNCMTDRVGGGSLGDGTAITTADWTIDGTWYVAVASTGQHPQIVGSRDPSAFPDAGELPAETTTAGDWTIRLVQPPPDIQTVCTSTGDGANCGHIRPD